MCGLKAAYSDNQSMLNDIKVVLSHPTHPGNIGAAARALKTMGVSRLALVNPKRYPCAEATERASGAQDILANAQVTETVQQAIAECRLVIGTSARSRTLPWPLLEPRELAKKIVAEPDRRPVALLFGTENSGLTNNELQLCHYHVCIPTNPEYSSLNLASAVQLLCYEMRLAALDKTTTVNEALVKETLAAKREQGEMPATALQVEQLHEHFEQVLEHTGFFDPDKPKLMQFRLHRIFNKAQLTDSEVRLLRGALASIGKYKST